MLVSCFLKPLQRFPINSEQNAYSLPHTYITPWSPCLSSHPLSCLSPQMSLSFSHFDSLSSTNMPSSLLLEGVGTLWNLLSPRSFQSSHSVWNIISPTTFPHPAAPGPPSKTCHPLIFSLRNWTVTSVLLFICLLIYWPLFSHTHLTFEFI